LICDSGDGAEVDAERVFPASAQLHHLAPGMRGSTLSDHPGALLTAMQHHQVYY
jgi:hypothetical protein